MSLELGQGQSNRGGARGGPHRWLEKHPDISPSSHPLAGVLHHPDIAKSRDTRNTERCNWPGPHPQGQKVGRDRRGGSSNGNNPYAKYIGPRPESCLGPC